MPSPAPAPCLHELRPGTKVCLHCRRAEREARAAHRNRIFVRMALTGMALAVGVVGVRAGIEAFRNGSLPQIPILMAATTKAIVESLPGTPAPSTTPAPPAAAVSGPSVLDSSPVAAAVDSLSGASPAAVPLPVIETVALSTPGPTPHSAPPSAAAAPGPAVTALPSAPPPASTPSPAPVVPPLLPIVAEGRTDLTGGVFAVRAGDTVTLYFDTPDARTRRPEKFEQVVRATLPLAYGSAADALLASVAPGALIGAVDLVTELPARGLHLRASDGRALSIWPETRPGRDGPLVIAYRATLAR